jgi:serine/threonine protein kinase
MINYKPIEVIHSSASGKTVILKVKESNANNNKIYALKLVSGIDNNLQRLIFKREIEALQILNTCGGIVNILDSITGLEYKKKGNWGGILLEYVHGESLDNIDLSQHTQLDKYQLCLKILYAVRNAHNNDVIHRDLKPSNIMYDETTGKITIIDFGTSKIKSIIETETTMPLYSENYSAPEVVKGNETTEASDIYSLGVIIFEIIFGIDPNTSEWMLNVIEASPIRSELKETLTKMLQGNISDRVIEIDDIISVFTILIGELNVGALHCNIFVDSEKLDFLKRKNIIQQDTNMSIFTKSLLRKDFREKYGYFDERKQLCIITGSSLQIECSYDIATGRYDIARINEVAVDRRNGNIKRSFKIESELEFFPANSSTLRASADNKKLWVQFQNHTNEHSSSREQEDLFDELFGGWQKGLEEAIKTEKDKVGKIYYTNGEIIDKELILSLDKYENNSIDDVTSETKYIREDIMMTRGKTPVYYQLGNYSDVKCDDNDDMNIIINLTTNLHKARIKDLLKKKIPIIEDFRANIGSYKKQFRAIKALHDDNCPSKNLKDIILNIEEPISTPKIANKKFVEKKLNTFQQDAVRKALESESLSLIQGPPGTGKTKVIKEIIAQITSMSSNFPEPPKILVVSQSHTAVDNILEGLESSIPNKINIIRIGKEKDISPEVAEKYTLSAIRDRMYDRIKEKAKIYTESKEEQYNDIDDKQELERWGKIKSIQEDWLNRCGDFDSLDYHIIRNATITAGTCIGFLANDHIKETTYDYVIVDEAAKATTPELLVSIIKARKIVLVGDQNQLPAYADEKISPTLVKLTKSPKYRLFDILFEILPNSHKTILRTQYRMKRNIGDLISKIFYDCKIDTGIDDNKRLHCIKKYEGYSILWFDTSKIENHGQNRSKGGSYINNTENEKIKAILEDLKENHELENLDIGIITGYGGQKELLKKMVQNNEYNSIAKQIDINTLDAFQGRENDIIIYSTVRTKDSIGFQKEKERVNVAFSRARKLLIICGDLKFFYNYDNPDNKFIEIIDYLQEHDNECKIIQL